MTTIDQSGLVGKTRDRPISRELELVLLKAGSAAGIDKIYVTSGGQPGTGGRSTGSTRHNGGRAADLRLIVNGKTLTFTDADANDAIKKFVISAAAHGATGIGAGVLYMGKDTLHVGFGQNQSDRSKLVWGAGGRSKNAPNWLKIAANQGWTEPPSWAFETDDSLAEDLPEEDDVDLETEELDDAALEVPKRFNVDVIRAAQATQRRWGVPASVTLAQWAIESGYGHRMPAGSNNPFGIKAHAGQPQVTAWTTEYENGRKKLVQELFRAFASLEEAFLKHGELLGTSSHYTNARKFSNDPDKFADALTGIYATDPNYGSLLKSVMRSNNLYIFDNVGGDGVSGDIDEEIIVNRPLQQGDVDPIRVTSLQRRLVDLGYKLGKIDGKFGSMTGGALLAFQNDNGLPTTGVLDSVTEAALAKGPARRLDPERVTATEKDLADKGSRIVIDARRSRILSWIAGAFGALGVGNSAIVNSASGVGAATASSLPTGLLPFLAEIQQLPANPAATQLSQLTATAKTLSQQLSALSLPPELVQTLDQLRRSLPTGIATSNPEVAAALSTIGEMASAQPHAFRTVFDILPSFFANGTALQTIMQGVATVGASVMPGFGGSLGVLGIGLVGRFLANRIAAARVENHRTGDNIRPLED
jgi:peptidoglycan hydrolase-like protein with peptidoglycan-binding domain